MTDEKRCRTCRHWEDPPDPDDYDPEWGAGRRCDLYETLVMQPDFGCVQWEKECTPATQAAATADNV